MRLANPFEFVLLLHNVQRAIVTEGGYREVYESSQSGLIVEGRAEHPACLGQQRGALLRILRLCTRGLFARERMGLFLRAPSRCHVAEAPDSSNRNIVDPLWLRVALKRAAIFELQHVVARFSGMAVKLDHLGEEFLRINQFIERCIDSSLIVAASEDFRRNLPHVRHFLVEAEDFSIQIHDENSVRRGLERGA